MPIQKKPSSICLPLSSVCQPPPWRIVVPPASSRKEWIFKHSKDNMKAINMHLRGGDYRAIVPLAEDIRDWASKMPDYFPQGSDGKPSEAAP